jgi:FSR family fosmidomycin resistance protein-like MFS transporter
MLPWLPFCRPLSEAETGNLWLAGFALTLYEATGVFGVLTAGSLSDYLGRRKVLFDFTDWRAACAVSVYSGPADGCGWQPLCSQGFLLLSTTPVMLAMVQENAKSSPAAANGFFMMMSFHGALCRCGDCGLVGGSFRIA